MRTALISGAAIIALAGFCDAAEAGAWTLNRHASQIITGVTTSSASRRFDTSGNPTVPVQFNKILIQRTMEYGLTDAVTVFASPEYVFARYDMMGTGARSTGAFAIEAGTRILLLSRIGQVSLQVSGKSAGGFNMSVSSSSEAGRQFESRLLYGSNFTFLRRPGFFDVEIAYRWVAQPRPDEYVYDATLGWWLNKKYLLLVQSFNCATASTVLSPYQSYHLNKVEVSTVQMISRRWSLQSGYFLSYSGRNIVRESGFVMALWFKT